MNELVGKKILGISIDDDDQWYLQFDTDEGSIVYYAEGDCCSESWFYHVLGVRFLIGQVVREVEEVAMPDLKDNFSRQAVDTLYGFKLRTDLGVADIEFRNSSNGYYGGQLCKVLDVPDSVYMTPLTDDYTVDINTD
jgi:hypothetical protein